MNLSFKKVSTVFIVFMMLLTSFIQLNASTSSQATLVGFNVTNKNINTFIDEGGKAPEALIFTVQLSGGQSGSPISYNLEIPFEGFTPNGQAPFENFTMTDPIFEYVGLGTVSGVNVLDSKPVNYTENGKLKSKLVIALDQVLPGGSYTINFRLKLNDVYLGKIPQESILWQSPFVNLVSPDDETVIQTYYFENNRNSSIKSVFAQSLSIVPTKRLPSGSDKEITSLRSDQIAFNIIFRRRRRNFYELADNSNIKIIVELPISLELSTATLNNSAFSSHTVDTSSGSKRIYSLILQPNHNIYADADNVINNGEYYINNMIAQFYDGQIPEIGTLLDINVALEYQFKNAAVKTSDDFSQSQSPTLQYRLEESQNWNLYYTGEHYTNQVEEVALVDTSIPNSISSVESYYGSFDSYSHARGFRNEGLVPIKGISHYIYQDAPGSPKMDFGKLSIFFYRSNNQKINHYFKIKLHIRNAKSNSSREHIISGPNNSPLQTTWDDKRPLVAEYKVKNENEDLTTLTSGEYIEKVELIPYGDVTQEEMGYLMPGYSFSIVYKPKMWSDLKWPDGSSPDSNTIYPIDIKSASTFLNEHPTLEDKDIKKPLSSSSQNANIQNNKTFEVHGYENNVNTVYYGPSKITTLDFNVTISDNIINTDTGNEIQITGNFVTDLSNGGWKDPVILIKLPKVVTITTKSFKLGLTNTLANDLIDMDVTLLKTDANSKYYKLKGKGLIDFKKNSANIVEGLTPITLDFEVDQWATQGALATYAVQELLYGGSDFNAFYRKDTDVKNIYALKERDYSKNPPGPLSSVQRNQYGLVGEDATLNFAQTHVALKKKDYYNHFIVPALGTLDSIISSRATTNDQFTESTFFGVNNSGEPQIKLEMHNNSNYNLTNIKLYTVLNYSNNNLGFTPADIKLKSIQLPSGATAYYSKDEPNVDHPYEVDISNWTESDLLSRGFKKNINDVSIGGASNVKQIVILFGNMTPNQTVAPILTFKIPDTGQAISVNQFIYNFRQIAAGTLNQLKESKTVAFSTELYQINYSDPSGHATDMPNPNYLSYPIPQNEEHSMSITNSIPKRYGYDFNGWKNTTYEDPNIYGTEENQVGSYSFSGRNNKLINLEAQWKAKTSILKFNANTADGVEPNDAIVQFGINYSIVAPLNLSKIGYTFKEWNTLPSGLGDSYPAGSQFTMDSEEASTNLYAIWQRNTYTVTFDTDGGSLLSPINVLHGDSLEVSNLTTTKIGYTINKWIFKDTNKDFVEGQSLVTENTSLKVVWTPKESVLNFDANGGENNGVNPAVIYHGIEFEVPYITNQLFYFGKEFLGWNTDKNAVTPLISNDLLATNRKLILTPDGEPVTLYAIWVNKPIKIILYPNNGTNDPIQTLDNERYGESVEIPGQGSLQAPIGHTFGFWSTSPGSGQIYYPGTNTFTPSNNEVTLYARWKPKAFTITFDGNGGTSTESVISSVHGANITIPSDGLTSRPNYKFVSWNTIADGSGQEYKPGNYLFETNGVNITLYAQWMGNSHTITFNDGVTNETVFADEVHNMKYGDAMPSAPANPTRVGYTLIGWDPALSNTVTQDQIYEAQWTPKDSTITFDFNGGTGAPITPMTIQHGVEFQLPLITNEITLIGKDFLGWNTDARATSPLISNDPGNTSRKHTFNLDGEPVTLYAIWKAKSFTIKFDGNGGTSTESVISSVHGATITIPGSGLTSRPNYKFVSWNTQADGLGTNYSPGNHLFETDGVDVTLYAQWIGNSHTITYTDGVTNETVFADEVHTVNYGDTTPSAPANPTRTGYTFSGWSPALSTTVTQDQTYTAIWEGNPHTITFNDGVTDETVFADEVHTANYGDALPSAPTIPLRNGYTFKGWSPSLASTVTQDQVYEAQWEVNQYQVNIKDTNGRVNQTIELKHGEKLYADDYNIIYGYTLNQWYLNGQPENPLGKEIRVTMDMEITLEYEPNIYTLIFDPNGGNGVMLNQMLTYDLPATLKPNSYTRIGYDFVGWKIETMLRSRMMMFNLEQPTALLTDGEDVLNLASFGTVSLIAQWKAKSYEVYFDLNGGKGTFDAIATSYDQSFVLPAKVPSFNGKEFKSWNTRQDGSGTTYAPEDVIINISTGEAVTLYAIWIDEEIVEVLPQTGIENSYYEYLFLYSGLFLVALAKVRKKKLQ